VFDIFIRDSVFPHLESCFPDLRKRDFDSLLKRLQSTVEYFEIDPADVGRIHQLASITKMPPEKVAAVFGRRSFGSARPTSVAWLASDAMDYVTGATPFVDGKMTLYPGCATGS
jgi:hypothetical protein